MVNCYISEFLINYAFHNKVYNVFNMSQVYYDIIVKRKDLLVSQIESLTNELRYIISHPMTEEEKHIRNQIHLLELRINFHQRLLMDMVSRKQPPF